MTPAELAETAALCRQALREHPDREQFFLAVPRPVLQLFMEFCYSLDPDMPSLAICKILGPLVGDVMMNEKLNRLDDIANSLGPTTLRLMMLADRLERRRVR